MMKCAKRHRRSLRLLNWQRCEATLKLNASVFIATESSLRRSVYKMVVRSIAIKWSTFHQEHLWVTTHLVKALISLPLKSMAWKVGRSFTYYRLEELCSSVALMTLSPARISCSRRSSFQVKALTWITSDNE